MCIACVFYYTGGVSVSILIQVLTNGILHHIHKLGYVMECVSTFMM